MLPDEELVEFQDENGDFFQTGNEQAARITRAFKQRAPILQARILKGGARIPILNKQPSNMVIVGHQPLYHPPLTHRPVRRIIRVNYVGGNW